MGLLFFWYGGSVVDGDTTYIAYRVQPTLHTKVCVLGEGDFPGLPRKDEINFVVGHELDQSDCEL
jgi:hypothetical protein